EAVECVVARAADERIVARRAVEHLARRRAIDYQNVGRCEGEGVRGMCAADGDGSKRGDQLCTASPVPIRIVEELSGRRVIDNSVVGVVTTRCPGSCEEAHITVTEASRYAQGAHHPCIELNGVDAGSEVVEVVCIGGARRI